MRAVIALFLLSTPALASSEAAWEAFRADVMAKCQALVGPAEATIEVNPFGSERFGAAIVTTHEAAGDERFVCIYDKAGQAAELTAPFPPELDSPDG